MTVDEAIAALLAMPVQRFLLYVFLAFTGYHFCRFCWRISMEELELWNKRKWQEFYDKAELAWERIKARENAVPAKREDKELDEQDAKERALARKEMTANAGWGQPLVPYVSLPSFAVS